MMLSIFTRLCDILSFDILLPDLKPIPFALRESVVNSICQSDHPCCCEERVYITFSFLLERTLGLRLDVCIERFGIELVLIPNQS
jgi:hypothetical protein